MIPSKAETKRFVNAHPIVTIFSLLVIGDASFRLLRAFTSPKGSSPYTNRYMGQVSLGGISSTGLATCGVDHEETSLGLSTSTTTSTSSSHAAMAKDPVPTMQQDFNIPMKEFGTMRKGKTPPALRRRLSHGSLGQVKNSFLGKQVINEKDAKASESATRVPQMFAMDDITPEQAEGWTE